jgi:cytochrome oxidase Cu insertion factor (SCO1/SenC/PrrC family)
MWECIIRVDEVAIQQIEDIMKRIVWLLLLILAGHFPVAAQEDAVAKTNLKVGDVAPDFSLLSDKWEQVKLSDFRGKKNVVLAFYVLAFTGG